MPVYYRKIMLKYLVFFLTSSPIASYSDTWFSFATGSDTMATSYNCSIAYPGTTSHGCIGSGSSGWASIINTSDPITVRTPEGAYTTAKWVGIVGGFSINIGVNPSARFIDCSTMACYGMLRMRVNITNENLGCQYPGVNCSNKGAWMSSANSNKIPSLGPAFPLSQHVTANISSPTYVLVVDDPLNNSRLCSRNYVLPGSNTSVPGCSQRYALPVTYGLFSPNSSDGSLYYRIDNPLFDLPPINPPPVFPELVCDGSVDGDIDLGTLDANNALGASGSTWFRIQCTPDGSATVSAELMVSGETNNKLSLGGLSVPVTFDDNSSQKIWTVSSGTTESQRITATVTSLGLLVEGDYEASMVLRYSYE